MDKEDVSGNTVGPVVSATSPPGVCGGQEKNKAVVLSLPGACMSLKKVETLLGCGAVPSSSVVLQSLQFSGSPPNWEPGSARSLCLPKGSFSTYP